ncbi:MAG: ABC transporter ATP-binding protein [Anaerolineaceae bacterium]
MLKLENVSKTYRTGTFGGKALQAVNDISFTIKDGEVLSLIGESGSGKSTIGKMILRLISTTQGHISLDDKDIQEYPDREYYRKVQGIFQDPFSCFNPIFKADRVFKIIHEEFYPHVPDQEWQEKTYQTIKSVGLNPEHVVDKYPHQLSGGQLQRFLIARALLLDIQFLVADEIISMLDASTRIDVLNLLAELKARGLSILFITHDLSLANYISERAIILYRGCAAEIGDIDSVFVEPLHPYTQMLIASVPRLDQEWDREATTVEQCLTDMASTPGCVYADRCPYVFDFCKVAPPMQEVKPGHLVSCWKYQN